MSTTTSQSTSSSRSNAFLASIEAPVRKIDKIRDQFGKEAPISEYFGCMTFGLAQMREKLPKDAYSHLIRTLDNGKKLPKETAEYFGSNTAYEGLLDEKLEIELKEGVHYEDWSDESSQGFEVDLTKLPKGVTKLRFYNNW